MMTRTKGRIFRKTMATGLVVSVLLLTVLPGCTARHMPDWSRVQAVSPQTKTHVRLYSNQKVQGRFHSAADDSLTLTLRDGQERTLPKQSVHKVFTRRAWWEGLPGWVALGVSVPLVVVFLKPSTDLTPSGKILVPGLATGITAAAFYGSRTGLIYKVPPKHRTPPPAKQPDAGKESSREAEGSAVTGVQHLILPSHLTSFGSRTSQS